MSLEKNFKGFSLDENGCVQGAYPCFSSVIESQVNKISELENEYVMKIFRNLHIDTDVLMKQKAEIDRLSFENEQLKKNIAEDGNVIRNETLIRPWQQHLIELLEKNERLEKENEQLKNTVMQLREQVDKMKNCSNCNHYNRTYELCQFSLGDEDYDCRSRNWELAE